MKNIGTCILNARQEQIVKGIKRKVELIPLGQESVFESWANTGRCGTETSVHSLEKHKGDLYAGCSTTLKHVWRYNKVDDWDDMGNPSYPSSSDVLGLVSSNNELYAGLYNGKMRRFISPGDWENCGTTYSIRLLFEYEGNVCAGVGTIPGRIMRWNGGTSWSEIGRLGGNAVMCVHLHTDGKWYGGCSNSGHLWRNDGVLNWTDLGLVDTNVNGIYSLASHKDELYIGTEMAVVYEDRIYKYNAPNDYTYCGYPGESNIIRCMVDYKDLLLVGTNDKAYVYLYRGGTLWEDISGQLNSESSLWAFKEWDDKIYVGTKSHGQVWFSRSYVEGSEIATVKSGIGRITQRVERNLNQFQPADISITAKEPVSPIFFKGDQSGLFDKEKLNRDYQVKIFSGIEGCEQWILKFDGKVKKDVKRPIRERVTFTGMGWLNNAKRYNAEPIADPDNPPFKNISGVSFLSMGDGSKVSAKKMNHGIDSDIHWLQFDGGGKKNAVEDETIELWDSVKESHIFVEVDHSELPDDDQEDSFSVIKIGGTLKAVGWWENIPFGTDEGLISKILTECGVTEQDIQVEEIEDIISQKKNFIFMKPVTSVPDGNITAFRVVEIDEPNKTVKTLVGITAKSTLKCYVYLFTYQYNVQRCEVKYIFELSDYYQVRRFLKFGDRWWALISARVKTEPSNYARLSYDTAYLKNFDSNWDEDYSYKLTLELAAEYDFIYAHSGSVLGASANDIYFVGQKHTTGQDKAKLFKLTWNGSILSHTLVKLLRTPTTDNACYIDEWASLVPESAETFYYFGIRKNTSPNFLEIRKYGLTSDSFTDVKSVDPCTGQIDYFTRNTYSVSYRWQGYFMYHESSTVDKAWWIGAAGQLYEEVELETIKNMIYGNPDFVNYYNWWHDDADGYCYIKSMHAEVGSSYVEVEKLDEKYSIEEVAPEMFQGTFGDWNFVGITMEKGSKVISPFLYMPGKVPIIEIADLTDMNCKDALTKVAEAICCNFDIYEMTKARFYYRGTTGGEMTLDSGKEGYIKQPVISYWENQCDGVIVENSEKGIRYRVGNTGFGDKIIEIDNVFVSSRGMAESIAEWLYTFFNERRLLISVDVKFLVEIELFDKITIKLRNKDGTLFREIETIVIETSFEPSPFSEKTHNVSLKLLQLIGDTLHIPHLIELDETSEIFVTV